MQHVVYTLQAFFQARTSFYSSDSLPPSPAPALAAGAPALFFGASLRRCPHSSSRTHCSEPGYAGSSREYLLAIPGGTNLPPRKWWGPSKNLR